MRGTLLALALLSAACHHGPKPEAAEPQAETTVKVENQSFLDVDVFVLQNGLRIRLGRAASLTSPVFTIPAIVVRGASLLRFDLRPIGGAGAAANSRTETIPVQPGDQVVLMIPPS
ncbi:MAG: hypothetical protein ABR537_01550 [Gemmatimonadales bacterium]